MMAQNSLRGLPSVEKLLTDSRIGRLYQTMPREAVADIIRAYLMGVRKNIVGGGSAPSPDEIIEGVMKKAGNLERSSLRRVINATGVILHTNLGRAPLSEKAISAMDAASHGYNNLEFDLESGERGSRHVHVEPLLCQLTGAESAVAVNNNAGALLLGLAAIARRKEVIISRGEEVQIGGGFRVTEIMRESGAKLVEVGTTNCTYIEDYENAITPKTAAILKVHTSNFKITGFTQSVALEELVALGNKYNLPVLDDIGSGCLFDATRFGLDAEPRVQDSLEKGASLVFFSGDKVLGGPQAGIILGKKVLVDKLKKHPLARALRMDKMRLAALAETLKTYLRGMEFEELPALKLIATPLSETLKRARNWARKIGDRASVISGESAVGGGSLPGSNLPTYLVAVRVGEANIAGVVKRLREHEPPVVARVSKNLLLLDPRCVFPNEEKVLIKAVKEAIKRH